MISLELETVLRKSARRLDDAGVPSPRVDAELLACHVLDLSRSELSLRSITGAGITDDDAERFCALVAERARRIPLQHLTGVAPFRTLELRVGPGAFIPRPETEQVVQAALDRLTALHSLGIVHPRVVDLGTGSGAIAASIASEHPSAEVHAVELSETAAAWAEVNLAPLGVTLHRADLRELPQAWESSFDVVISNPPYIPGGMVPAEAEVRDHDPELALYGGGEDGLEIPRAVITVSRQILRPGGWFILEHAEQQAKVLRRICEQDPRLSDVATHCDLTGRDRATSATVRGGSAFQNGENSVHPRRPCDDQSASVGEYPL